MSEALLLVAEGYEQIAAGIRKMVAAQKDTPKKEEKPVKKAEKKETPVADTPKEEAAPKETAVDRKTVRAFLADKSRSGKTSEVKNLDRSSDSRSCQTFLMRNCRNCMRKRRCSNGRTRKVLPIVRQKTSGMPSIVTVGGAVSRRRISIRSRRECRACDGGVPHQ